MADNILHLPDKYERKKREDAKYTWFICKCVNVTFSLRSDGAVICDKCKKVVAEYQLTDGQDPKDTL